MRRAALRIPRKENSDCHRFSAAEQSDRLRNDRGITPDRGRNERLRSGDAWDGMGQKRTNRTEACFPVLLRLVFLCRSNGAHMRSVFLAARGNVVLSTVERQRRKKWSSNKQNNQQSCKHSTQSAISVQQAFGPGKRTVSHKLRRSTVGFAHLVTRIQY